MHLPDSMRLLLILNIRAKVPLRQLNSIVDFQKCNTDLFDLQVPEFYSIDQIHNGEPQTDQSSLRKYCDLHIFLRLFMRILHYGR